MNIHEYQAKAVLKSFGAPVAAGVPVLTLEDVQTAVETLPGPLWVVKSQIHAGGRGKGKFLEAAAGRLHADHQFAFEAVAAPVVRKTDHIGLEVVVQISRLASPP